MARMQGDVGYDEDVRPLFSAEDRERMRAMLDLWDFQQVRRSARDLLAQLPELSSGSPPAEPIFQRWIEDGCPAARARRYAAFFDELDAWTEYWDIDRPDTRGLYYFGDGATTPGYLSAFLPGPTSSRVPAFERWKHVAVFHRELGPDAARKALDEQAQIPRVREAVIAMDDLVCRLVMQYFGRPDGSFDCAQYLDAVEWFAIDALPLDHERFARVPDGDPRKLSSISHTMDGEIMWFAWAAHIDYTAHVLGPEHPRRALHTALAAGIALGCSMDYVFRQRCRSRSEYRADAPTRDLLRCRAIDWSQHLEQAILEIRDLFRIREYGAW